MGIKTLYEFAALTFPGSEGMYLSLEWVEFFSYLAVDLRQNSTRSGPLR